jgi:hypothetical protein
VQALAQRLQLGDQLAAVADRCSQRVERRRRGRTSSPLTHQPHERRAVAVVGLEATRPQLRPRGLRLRWREQAQRTGVAAFELGGPGAVQRTRRLNPDHRIPVDVASGDQPAELLDAFPQDGQRHRLADQATLAGGYPDPVGHLARIDRHRQPPLVKHAAKYGARQSTTS